MNAQGLIPVYLRITIDGERVEISSKRYVNPSHWNTNRQKLNGTGEDAKTINAYLKTLEHEIYEVHRTMIEKKLPLYEMSLKPAFSGKQIIWDYSELLENNAFIGELFNQCQFFGGWCISTFDH